jgi:uncharacterized membrane protein YphA (DoxX/SURF4 family)
MKKIFLIIFRFWLGLTMIYNGRFIFVYAQDIFWHNYFKNVLHFPFPDLMFYLAKGAEFFGGLFLLLGLMTRISACFLAFTMLVATLFANPQSIFGGFGSITFSYFLFSVIFMLEKPSAWSIDHLLAKKNNHEPVQRPAFNNKAIQMMVLFTVIRIWFGSLLIVDSAKAVMNNKRELFFDWMLTRENRLVDDRFFWITLIAEIILGMSIISGLFKKISGGFVALIMLCILVFSLGRQIDHGGYYFLLSVILCWFGCIFWLNPPSYPRFSKMAD